MIGRVATEVSQLASFPCPRACARDRGCHGCAHADLRDRHAAEEAEVERPAVSHLNASLGMARHVDPHALLRDVKCVEERVPAHIADTCQTYERGVRITASCLHESQPMRGSG